MKTVKIIVGRLQGEQTPVFIYFRDLENHSQSNFEETHTLPSNAGCFISLHEEKRSFY